MELVFSRRTGRRALLALLAALLLVVQWASTADASVTVNATSMGAGTIVTGAGTTSASYAPCDKLANRDDRVQSACPGQTIPTATSEICIPFGGCTSFPVASTLVLAAVPAPTPIGHWRFLRWDNCPGDTNTTDNLCAISNSFVATTATPRAVFDDFVGPTVTAISPNFSTTVDRGVSFGSPVANEGLSAVNCQIDGAGAFTPCGNVRQLSVGTHVVRAQGVDLSGNTGATSAVLATFPIVSRDDDGDGFNQISDCNDANAGISPIASDLPGNGVDENCDGADAIDPDRDDDGFQPPSDCNDDNPGIRPGVPDTPDNGVDENCDGTDAKTPPLPRIPATVSFNFPAPGKTGTKFTVFLVKTVPAGSKIVATCKGTACGKKPPKQTINNAKGTVRLKKFQRVFKVGSVIEVRVTKSGMEGIVKQVKINKKKNPSILTKCLVGSRVVNCT